MSEELTCPFCGEDGFDSVGLCLHLNGNCGPYDRACRMAAEEQERRWDRNAQRNRREGAGDGG